MLKITKIFNNNAVLSQNDAQQEIVVLGKGVGFNKKVGDDVENAFIEKTFSLNQHIFSAQLVELLNTIPLEYFRVVNLIVQYANKQFHQDLSHNIYLSLSDHLFHAILRLQQNKTVQNHLLFEIKRLYKTEFAVGLYAKEIIQQHLHIEIDEDEVGFIALHIFNARTDVENMANTIKITQIIRDILNLIKYHFRKSFDENSLHYSRLITHLQYFAMRLFNAEKSKPLGDDFLYLQTKNAYPLAYECVEKISHYLEKHYQRSLNNDERLYLTIHIQRVITE